MVEKHIAIKALQEQQAATVSLEALGVIQPLEGIENNDQSAGEDVEMEAVRMWEAASEARQAGHHTMANLLFKANASMKTQESAPTCPSTSFHVGPTCVEPSTRYLVR